jgi:hypoxanthine phosphoribosyltransferase
MAASTGQLREMWRFLEESDPVASAQEVQAAIARVAGEIEAALSAAYPLVLVLMRGAVVFAGQLLPRLRFPLELDYLDVTRYGAETRGREPLWRVDPPGSVRGRAVLLLDDILDRGRTLEAVRQRVLALGAASFQCAVLVDKQTADPRPVAADFVGLRVPDRFVFGCGMDAGGRWRNLPEIRAMKGS